MFSPSVEKQTKARQFSSRLNRPFKSPVVKGPNTSTSTPSPATRENNKRVLYQSPLSQQTGMKSSSGNPPMKRTKLSSTLLLPARSKPSLEELSKHEMELDREIASLQSEGFMVEELDRQIDLLHRYNDIKDVAQMVLGRLAELEGVTVKSLHEKYDAPLCS